MTLISFQTAFIAIAQIFLMGAIGFFIVRRGYVSESGLKVLSWLSINVIFPFFIFYQIVNHFNPSVQSYWWSYPLINVSLCIGGTLLALGISKVLKKNQSHEWMATSGFHNAGYIPLLLITMLPLGEKTQELYSYVLLSIIGFDLCLWTLGVQLITHHQKPRLQWKSLINPPLVSMFLAFVLVLLGLKGFLPDILMKPIKIVGDGALAIVMIIIGGNLALTRFDQIQWKQIGASVLIKLFLLPLAALLFLFVVPVEGPWGLILIIQACMPTSITISVIARSSDNHNQNYINQMIFVTHLLCGLTIPLFLGLYGRSF